ncbi:PH domain-containing protein [Streptomyces sp. SID486]|uniref:PH domain-containing protein n=1 Tax=unclassified Streptomyces TaxID=2593676 RepID=UPI00136A47AC|nr:MULTISPECIES: PH domain-containing protein [unclassified Streptomyces]MYW17353.1 PH domain-containing protein [Streptomyces sp. SID2955]MYW47732.1 PH domain-containing protein [Streptomyces sp. SID161]MYX93969.1 PH domain-containing protein [Streptomyces sp. SID486]
MSDLPALPVTFRPGHTRVILLTAGVVMFLTMSGIALLLEQLGPGDRLTFIITGALIFWFLAQLARVKVVADETGVTVVNIVSKRRLAWAEILRVNLRAGDPWVFLDLSDGTSLAALGIQPGIAKQRAVADARTLRALAEAHSGPSALPHEPRS